MTTNDEAIWRYVLGYPPEGIFVIIDPQVGERQGQLRALPLLTRIGSMRFTFAAGWHRFDLVPFMYLVINEGTSVEEIIESFPICQFISQDMESASPSDVTKKLLMAHKITGGKGLLVYVLDSEQFMLRESTHTKTFIDEYNLKRTVDYQSLFARYCAYVNRPLNTMSSSLSLNLKLHELSWDLGEKTLLGRLGDLFAFERLPADSWAWDLLEWLADKPAIQDDELEVSRLLRAWIDHDITRIGRLLFDKLQEFNFELTKVQAERQRLSGQQ